MTAEAQAPPGLLFVVNDARYFLQSYRTALALEARRRGWAVTVATAASPAQAEIADKGLATATLPISRFGTGLLEPVHGVAAAWRLCRRERPRIVHCVSLKGLVAGGPAALLAGVPGKVYALAGLGHVFTSPGLKWALVRFGLRRLVRLVLTPRARLVVQLESDRDQLRLPPRLAERVRVISNSGVDLERFRPAPEPNGKPRVLLANRLIWKKGIGEFVEAARILKARGVDAEFVLAGDSDAGNPAGVPEATLRAWHDEGVVEWLGFRRDVPDLLAGCHVACLPSYYGEGVPKGLLEPMAAGRPVVATDTPGCRAVCRHEVSGLLVPPRDAEALADAFQRLIEDPALRRRLGRRGRAIAEAEYSLDAAVADTFRVYDEVLS